MNFNVFDVYNTIYIAGRSQDILRPLKSYSLLSKFLGILAFARKLAIIMICDLIKKSLEKPSMLRKICWAESCLATFISFEMINGGAREWYVFLDSIKLLLCNNFCFFRFEESAMFCQYLFCGTVALDVLQSASSHVHTYFIGCAPLFSTNLWFPLFKMFACFANRVSHRYLKT